MKKIIAGTLLLAVATLTIHAQDVPANHEGSRGRDRHQSEGFRHLQLSEDQKAKFKTENDEFRKQMQDLKKKDDITVKEWKNRMQTLRNDHHTKVQALLTTEQKAQLKKQKDDRSAHRKKDREARAEKMKTKLGLSDDQAAKMKKSHTEMAEKVKAIKENKSLTDDQRKEQFHQLREQQRESLKSILSADQLKKLQEKQGRRHSK